MPGTHPRLQPFDDATHVTHPAQWDVEYKTDPKRSVHLWVAGGGQWPLNVSPVRWRVVFCPSLFFFWLLVMTTKTSRLVEVALSGA